MPSNKLTTGAPLIVAAMLAGGVVWGVQNGWVGANVGTRAVATPPAVAQVPRAQWAASAPGRVEPRSGEVRVGVQVPGRITDLHVAMNDRVLAGDLLLRLDDADAVARLAGADAEAAVRKRERDGETVPKLQTDRRIAEDNVANAERAHMLARIDLDRLLVDLRAGKAKAEDVTKGRAALQAAREKVDAERAALRRVQATAGMPLPTRLEASLATARSEVALAEVAIERMRVRAPVDGSVLQINAKVGETVAPSVDIPLIAFGDVSGLRVRAELDERDVAKVRAGQAVVVRSDAYQGREFPGRIAALAQALGPSRLANRGPRRPNDVDVLEVVIDLDGLPPLLPGMRVDVFFRPDATVESAPPAKAN